MPDTSLRSRIITAVADGEGRAELTALLDDAPVPRSVLALTDVILATIIVRAEIAQLLVQEHNIAVGWLAQALEAAGEPGIEAGEFEATLCQVDRDQAWHTVRDPSSTAEAVRSAEQRLQAHRILDLVLAGTWADETDVQFEQEADDALAGLIGLLVEGIGEIQGFFGDANELTDALEDIVAGFAGDPTAHG